MNREFVTKLAMKAISLGLRLPKTSRTEAFYQHGRTIDEIKSKAINVVLDVGANRGHYARHLRMLGYNGFIVSFEPDPETFEHLKRASLSDDKWIARNVALSAEPGSAEFNVITTEDGETTLSSFYKHIADLPTKTFSVDKVTVAEVLNDPLLPSDRRIFLKMDTQGHDLEVFAGARTVADIKLLQSEVSVVPLYESMPSYVDALRAYSEAGFSLLDLFVVNRTEDGGVLEYDALMGIA